ncbi:divergent polysaccharide deacetylase family protein [Lacibacterium aquatile]|uniref:Divergent polysaccharide deacetylase family protein n=1 Tax=Lacibacterium aquatile TaxID=1168082 RepID=A0ABW5DVM1_9PROT
MAAAKSSTALTTAWLMLIAACAGAAAWIFDAGRFRPRISLNVPRVEITLPEADLSKVAGAKAPAPGETATAPTSQAAATTAPVSADPTPKPTEVALAPVDPALTEPSAYGGDLPKMSADHTKQPWKLYAGHFDASDPRPRIAVVMTQLGLSRETTDKAITELPAGVSFSYSPYSPGLPTWVSRARAFGHEAWLDLAFEPQDFPTNDPGPATLLLDLSPTDNIARMEWVLARAPAVVGVLARHGERMLGSDQAMAPLAKSLRERGLAWIDNRAVGRPAMVRLTRDFALPFGYTDIIVSDAEMLPDALHTVESLAGGRGTAVLAVDASMGAIERLKPWLETLEAKGFALAPATSAINRQLERFAVATQ